MKEKEKDRKIDSNFFRQMNYEMAAEHGIIDNQDMIKNKGLNNSNKKNSKNRKKP